VAAGGVGAATRGGGGLGMSFAKRLVTCEVVAGDVVVVGFW